MNIVIFILSFVFHISALSQFLVQDDQPTGYLGVVCFTIIVVVQGLEWGRLQHILERGNVVMKTIVFIALSPGAMYYVYLVTGGWVGAIMLAAVTVIGITVPVALRLMISELPLPELPEPEA